jgi:hypothetical protein
VDDNSEKQLERTGIKANNRKQSEGNIEDNDDKWEENTIKFIFRNNLYHDNN